MDIEKPTSAPEGDDFLVPVPRLDEGIPNSVSLATWHLALSNMIGTDIPHALMGVWLFPASGGVVLLAPEALGQDHVPIDPPAPRLAQDQLYQLEELFRTAGYRSAIAVPVRAVHADVGLLGFGDLREGLYGPDQAIRLHAMVRRLAPTFEALAESPPILSTDGLVESVTVETLPTRLAEAACRAGSGPDLVRLSSGVLQAVIPHDRLELVVGDVGQWHLLSGSQSRRRWGEQSTRVQQMTESLVEAVDEADTFSMRDLREEAPGVSWPTYFDSREGKRIRSFLAARLQVGRATVGYLFLGAVSAGAFRPDDEETLSVVATVLAPRVLAVRQERDLQIARTLASAETSPDRRVTSTAQLLATTGHWGEALRQFAGAVRLAIPFDHMDFALGLADKRVVLLEPGEIRPLGNLPELAAGDRSMWDAAMESGGAHILSLSHDATHQGSHGEVLIALLRIAGRSVGFMRLSGIRLEHDRPPLHLAQQFADIVAPHLEILLRAELQRVEPTAPPTVVPERD